MGQGPPAIEMTGVRFGWPAEAPLLSIPQFDVQPGETLFVEGPSGVGKSTFLSLISGVLLPTTGQISVFGTPLTDASATKRDAIRAERMGVIFQLFNLLPYLSPVENILLPCRFSERRRQRAGKTDRARREQACQLMERLGIADLTRRHRTATLSVGQQQRVAAARALIGEPDIILADEPTSSLDTDNRHSFLQTLLQEGARTNTTIIFVSHDRSLANAFSRRLSLSEFAVSHDKTKVPA